MTRYNKSRIMKEANRFMRVEGFTRSQALTLAWSKARRDEGYHIIEVRKSKRYEAKEGSIMFEMNMLASSLSSYYANNRYNGD